MNPVYCVRCKRQLSPDDDFCPSCGQSQRYEPPTEQAYQEPYYPPQEAPQPQAPPVVVVHQPQQAPSVFRSFLTGMGIMGGMAFGCFFLICLGIAAIMITMIARIK